jgi:hypothetical protein
MNTEWNFSYDIMSAPTKFNIRPTIEINNLTIWSGTNIIRGFSLKQILSLKIDMRIQIEELETFGTTKKITYIDVIEKIVYFTGEINYSVTPNNTFIFYSNPGVFDEQNTPLSGQQIHDNFFYLSEGLINHQERLSLVESYSLSVPSDSYGYVKYTGIDRTVGSFYGGTELEIIANSDFNTSTVYDPSSITSFSIAMNEGISYPDLFDSSFYIVSVGATLPSSHTFTPTTFCAHVNARLINDGSIYGFSLNSTVSLSTYNMLAPYVTSNWDLAESYACFYVRIDDETENNLIKIEFSQAEKSSWFSNVDQIISILNNKFAYYDINSKVIAKKHINGGDVRLLIEGISLREGNSPGCTRIQILNVGSGSFIENVLRMTPSATAFDFSTTIEFVPHNTKVKILGIDPSFTLIIKDTTATPLLERAGFAPVQVSGDFTIIHSAYPSEENQTLNFDGRFNAYELSSYSASFNILSTTSLTLTNLTVTGTNTYPTPINVSFEDLYVNNDLKVNDNSMLNTLTVTGASTFSNTLTLSGVNTISGATTFSSYIYITNTSHDENHTLYKSQLLNEGVLVPANAPENTLDNQYLLYNGSFGAFNIDAVGTMAIHGTTKANGRLYVGSNVPNQSAITLNYDGAFRATTVTGTSSRITKTDIKDSLVNALDILMHTQIVDYKFKTDLDTQRIGFIAEDTHTLLSTPTKDGVDITNSLGIIIKAIQELYLLTLKK